MITYRIIAYTHQRKKLFCSDRIIERLKSLIIKNLKENDYEVLELLILPDKVDITLTVPVNVSPKQAFTTLRRSVMPFKEKLPELYSKTPSLWQTNFFAQTVGKVDNKEVEKFEMSL